MNPAQANMLRWKEDPVAFVRDHFDVEPDAWQADVLRAFPHHQRIAMRACAGPGKTAVLAWLGWNFLLCYGTEYEHPKGAVTSITGDNLKDNLWPEFAKWQSRSPVLMAAFTWQKERIFAKEHPETWFLSSRGFSKSANPEEQGRTLSGLHSQYILYLIDESGDISPSVLRSAEQGLSNCTVGRIIQAGNTTSHDGMLYHAASRDREQWFQVSITADPDDPKRTPRVSAEWAAEQIASYGRENPWVMAYILGQFPPASLNSLLSVAEVEAAMGRHLPVTAYEWSQKRLGIDVARFGDDRTVIFPRQGLAAFAPVTMRGVQTTDIAARVAQAKAKWGSEMEFVDDTGHWGHGVIDNLLTAGFDPVGIMFHGAALDPRYKNKRAEMWFAMADWVKRGGALPNIPELVGELTTPTYTFNSGKLQLEDKDQVKKRLGRSPDLADALCLTFAMPDQPARTNLFGLEKPQVISHDYNPLTEAS